MTRGLKDTAQSLPRFAPGRADALRLLLLADDSGVAGSEALWRLTELSWEHLHVGDWRAVPAAWRELFAGAIVELARRWAASALVAPGPAAAGLRVLRLVDRALLVGAGPSIDALHALAKQLHARTPAYGGACSSAHAWPARALPGTQDWLALPECAFVRARSRAAPVRVLGALPTLVEFAQLMHAREPVVMRGVCDEWPAWQRWRDPAYWARVAGWRTVPVETGRSYVDDETGTALLHLGEYLDRVLEHDAREGTSFPGYLAQHTLFDQVPELRDDIVVPDYCACAPAGAPAGAATSAADDGDNDDDDDDDDDSDVRINAWIGPGGTVSALHWDAPENLLCQLVGHKLVVLCAPGDLAEAARPHDDARFYNTCPLDIASSDERVATIPIRVHVLAPGDTLYIPARHWHYVRALETSISVSFWYR